MRLRWTLVVSAVVLCSSGSSTRVFGEEERFVGDGRCGNPTCHGAGLPANEAQKKTWKPWKSARSQWLNRNIDHHSRAYATLQTAEGKTIATYMGIDATTSDKCLICHAPAATAAPGSQYKRSDGVSCEHCHGPAEQWLKPHVEKDWKDKKAQYADKGFYDNGNFRKRAEKCASCHVEIDHEIVAGGHPPLQFEMVAYAQIMKHWDDADKVAAGGPNPDPTLWSMGQLVGLRKSMEMIERRAGDNNYQSIGKFSHFNDKNCYQCHHKLMDDAVRQALGHYDMVDALTAVVLPDQSGALSGLWGGVTGGVASSPEQAKQRAAALAQWAASAEERVLQRKVDRDAARKILDRLTASGDKFKAIQRFSYGRPASSNVIRIDGIAAPWWYTTGAPEQVILAIQSLCEPACGKCGGMEADLRSLLKAVDRFDYRPDQFAQALRAINGKVCR